jgi:hypothetical protein
VGGDSGNALQGAGLFAVSAGTVSPRSPTQSPACLAAVTEWAIGENNTAKRLAMVSTNIYRIHILFSIFPSLPSNDFLSIRLLRVGSCAHRIAGHQQARKHNAGV